MTSHLRRLSIPICVSLLAILGAGCPQEQRSEPYVPGLGEIMSLTQMRHIKLWFAGQARNWELAAYETDELAEGFADVVRFHPTLGSSREPLSELVPELTSAPLGELSSAIESRDLARFTAAYDDLTRGCNSCHRAAGFSFNVVQRPLSNPYSNQRFAPGGADR